MDGLDKITLILLVCLVVVALLFPLSAGPVSRRDRRSDHGSNDRAAGRRDGWGERHGMDEKKRR